MQAHNLGPEQVRQLVPTAVKGRYIAEQLVPTRINIGQRTGQEGGLQPRQDGGQGSRQDVQEYAAEQLMATRRTGRMGQGTRQDGGLQPRQEGAQDVKERRREQVESERGDWQEQRPEGRRGDQGQEHGEQQETEQEREETETVYELE